MTVDFTFIRFPLKPDTLAHVSFSRQTEETHEEFLVYNYRYDLSVAMCLLSL